MANGLGEKGSMDGERGSKDEARMIEDMHDGLAGQIGEDEAFEVIPLEEFLDRYDANGPDADSDEEDQQSTSNYSGMGEPQNIQDDSLCALAAHEKDCFAVALHGERWLASGGEDDVAHIFDLNASQEVPVQSVVHDDSVTAVAFNSTGTLLASGDMLGRIIITQLDTLTIRAELNECSDLEWMFWHNSSDIIFAGDKDGMIWMWLISGKGVAQSKVYAAGAGEPCTAACLMSDGKRILAGYADGTVRLWMLKDQTNVSVRTDSAVVSIAHHPIHSIAAVGTEKGTVYLLNSSGESHLKKIHYFLATDAPRTRRTEEDMEEDENVDNCVECIEFAPAHPWVAAGRNDGSVCVYEVDTQGLRFLHRNESNRAIVRVHWVIEDNVPFLVTGSVDGTVRIFDSRNGSVAKELKCAGDEVLDMQIVQTNPLRLIAACSGGLLRIFDLSEQQDI